MCGAELGPWEGGQCLHHHPGSYWSIADQAMMVLEQEAGPLYLHDIQRGIARETGDEPYWPSVSAVVGTDRRFCWSGKGLYGLFRHGRIPGVRTLAEVASFLLVAADQPLSPEELGFLLSWSGYRFQQTSLDGALGRDGRFVVGWKPETSLSKGGWKATLADPTAERGQFEAMMELWPVDELVDRWRGRVREGLIERMQRLARARGMHRGEAVDD